MRVLLDITSIHRVGHVITSEKGGRVLPVDAVALLHLAEISLFCDSATYISFDNAIIADRTQEVIDTLLRNECLPRLETVQEHEAVTATPLIKPTDIDIRTYADCCQAGAMAVASMLLSGWLARDRLRTMAESINEASRPDHATVDCIGDIIGQPCSATEREEKAERELHQRKADGAVTYMILASDPLYEALVRSENDGGQYSTAENEMLRSIMRIFLNREIAKHCKAVYSPAPQRARTDELVERSFRHKVDGLLWQTASKMKRGTSYVGLMEEIAKSETLPLPALAIGYLQRDQEKGPLGLLRSAARCRASNLDDLDKVRSWLRKWEDAESSHDTENLTKAADELRRREKELRVDTGLDKPESILRMSLETLLLYLKGKPPEEPLMQRAHDLIAERLNRRSEIRSFLSLITRGLDSEKDLGKWLLAAINRTIVDG